MTHWPHLLQFPSKIMTNTQIGGMHLTVPPILPQARAELNNKLQGSSFECLERVWPFLQGLSRKDT